MVTRAAVGEGVETEQCTCQDEHWEMYGITESLHCTPETNVALYVDYTGIRIKSPINFFNLKNRLFIDFQLQ